MARKTREMIVVSDGAQVEPIEFKKELISKDDDRHGMVVSDFSKFYNLGLSFESVFVTEGNYNGYKWGVAIAKLGHLAIQKDNIAILYLPNIITDYQYEYLKSHKKEIMVYKNDLAIVDITIEDNKFKIEDIDRGNTDESLSLIDILYDKIEEKHYMENQGLKRMV